MASENTETNAGNDEETSPPSETNEHDYAHSAANTFASTDTSSLSGAPAAGDARGNFTAAAGAEQSGSGQPTTSVELPEPAVGAEVDCPGGNDVEASSLPQTAEDSQKAAASELAGASVAPGASRSGRRRSTRPEDRNCCCCKCEFERQGRSFNRRAVFTFTTPETVHWAFPGSTVTDKSFLCEICAQVIRSKCKRKHSGKRTLWLKPPVCVREIETRYTVISILRRFWHISPKLSLNCIISLFKYRVKASVCFFRERWAVL